jgi:hypothetical protein
MFVEHRSKIGPAPEEPNVCRTSFQDRAGSSGAECLWVRARYAGGCYEIDAIKHTPPLEAEK